MKTRTTIPATRIALAASETPESTHGTCALRGNHPKYRKSPHRKATNVNAKLGKTNPATENPPIPGARMPVAAFPVKMTDDSGAKRHTLCAPVSAANLVAAHLLRNPITAAELVSVLGVSDKALERVLDGKKPGAKFARRWRLHVGDDLVAAWREFEAWEREDERRRAKR